MCRHLLSVIGKRSFLNVVRVGDIILRAGRRESSVQYVHKLTPKPPFSESAPGEGDLREANVAFQKCTFLERYDRHV